MSDNRLAEGISQYVLYTEYPYKQCIWNKKRSPKATVVSDCTMKAICA